MSKFYATIRGNRNSKTCGGSNNSGILAAVQSYSGSVITKMHYEPTGTLMVRVGTNEGSSYCSDWKVTEFYGTFEELKELLQLANDIKTGRVSVVHHRKVK